MAPTPVHGFGFLLPAAVLLLTNTIRFFPLTVVAHLLFFGATGEFVPNKIKREAIAWDARTCPFGASNSKD